MAPSKSSIADYTLLPLTLPPSATLPSSKHATHTIYLRPHAPKIPTETDSRSLFFVNVPIDSTTAHFKSVFTSLIGTGRVEEVVFESDKTTTSTTLARVASNEAGSKKRKREQEEENSQASLDLPPTWNRAIHRSGSSAVVVMVDEKSVDSALKAIRKLHKSNKSQWPVWGEGVKKIPSLGSARYEGHYKLRYPEAAVLQAGVDGFMAAFNRREEDAAKEAKRVRNVPDEDGFVTVTRGGRTGPARMEEAERKRKELEEREKEKLGGRDGFYRFQTRERRKEEQRLLVVGFEEDRKRVESMRERRGKGGFRPER